MFAIKFQPWAAHKLWNINMNDATDNEISISELNNKYLLNLEEKINAEKDIYTIIYIVEKIIANKLNGDKKEDLKKAVQHVYNKNSADIFSDLSIGQRRVEQRFRHEIGISPKLLQRTFRINRVLKKMIAQTNASLTSLAYEFGYFDQSHFIYDFKKFTGCTPSRFLKSIEPDGDIFNLKLNI